jgi:predicted AlkP superfamily pyrophosphatase or phosphodiesterase
MQPVKPDYGAAWVGAVAEALIADQDEPWLPAAVAGAQGVVLLLLDGLGWNLLRERSKLAPVLAGMAGGPITTVAPSTTSAALTSIATGVSPAEHGIVGYRMRLGSEVLNVLGWHAPGGAPDPVRFQPRPAFGGRKVRVVTRAEFGPTGFTKAHLRGTRFVGWRTNATLVEHCRRLVAQGPGLVYAYYDGIDKIAHANGLHDGFLDTELAATDRLVGDLLDAMPAGWALVVSSDHGQVHVGPEGIVELDEVAGMVATMAGEGRFRSLHARAGASAELRAAAVERYGDRAWVFGREQLFDEGWLGPDASLAVRGRVGDVVLAAREPVAFIDPSFAQDRRLISFHGSLTPDEMLVPLVGARGTG